MTLIKTLSQDVIEIKFDCDGKTTYIYIKKIDSKVRVDILRMQLIDLSFKDAMEFSNILAMAVSIASEFDYCVEKFKQPENANRT